MKQTWRFGILAAAITAFPLPLMPVAEARPYPDRLGICYAFNGDDIELTQPCVIGSGYGAGAHYTVLRWIDGRQTTITMINACEPGTFDDKGFCRYTIDDLDATAYERDVFLTVTSFSDGENLSCYQAVGANESVCYRFD